MAKHFKLDTGASVNLISADNFNKVKKKEKIINSNINLRTYTNEKIQILGETKLKCHDTFLNFYVVKDNLQSLLGSDVCIKLKLIEKVNIIESENKISNFKDVFEGIGCYKIPQTITLTPNYKSKIHASRHVPYKLLNELKNSLEELENFKIIRKVTKPTEWVNPLMLVRKPNGKLRICLDPKDLNLAIKRQHYPIPTLDDISNKLAGSTIFSVIDATNGFYQLRLDQKSADYCTFATPFGRYQFVRLPFGLKCAPELFHKIFRELFDMKFILMIHAKDMVEHDKILEKVLNIARANNIKFNKTKSTFRQTEVKYMGHVFKKGQM